jgi:hypothetical protein
LRIRRPPEQIISIIIISRERDPSSSCADHHHRHRLGERGIHSLLAQIVIIIIILPGKQVKLNPNINKNSVFERSCKIEYCPAFHAVIVDLLDGL